MNKEVLDRIREAGKYQRMAVRALLPAKVAGHLEVIEGELKAMVKEVVLDAVKQELKKQWDRPAESEKCKEELSKVKKVTIV